MAQDTDTNHVLMFGHTGFTIGTDIFRSVSTGMSVAAVVSGGGAVGAAGGGAGSNYVYTFTTTTPAATAGRVTGSFTVPKTAVADGVLTASEVTSSNFRLVDATAPFVARPIEMYGEFQSPYGNEIRVNPATGAYLHDFLWAGRGNQGQECYLLPHRSMARGTGGQQYVLGNLSVLGDAPTGGGEATPVPAPSLGLVALCMLALLLAAIAARFLPAPARR